MSSHRSSSWPMAWMWAGLIVYASLHPFAPWRLPVLPPGGTWADLLWLPMSRYTRFDFWANYLAYWPLGLLTAIGWLRTGHPMWRALLQATLLGSLLSLCMEWTQYFLPLRVSSRMDWALNSAGALSGATLAVATKHWGVLAHWQRWRDNVFVPHGTLGMVLLLSWPIGLLFPTPVPLSLGQGVTRLALLLNDGRPLSPLTPALGLTPYAEALTTALGLLAPCLISFVMLRRPQVRLFTLGCATALGLSVTTLSTALNFGPDHALSWWTPTVLPGVLLGLALGICLAFAPRRAVALLGVLGLALQIILVNHSGADPYFALSLQAWEQGRFIRFHGLAQWIGWIWPFLALWFMTLQTAHHPSPPHGTRRNLRTSRPQDPTSRRHPASR